MFILNRMTSRSSFASSGSQGVSSRGAFPAAASARVGTCSHRPSSAEPDFDVGRKTQTSCRQVADHAVVVGFSSAAARTTPFSPTAESSIQSRPASHSLLPWV